MSVVCIWNRIEAKGQQFPTCGVVVVAANLTEAKAIARKVSGDAELNDLPDANLPLLDEMPGMKVLGGMPVRSFVFPGEGCGGWEDHQPGSEQAHPVPG